MRPVEIIFDSVVVAVLATLTFVLMTAGDISADGWSVLNAAGVSSPAPSRTGSAPDPISFQ